jgi:predicted nucleic acid-binding protein
VIGLDTSFLVAHAISEHPEHQEAHQWLDEALAKDETFAITSGILAEFIHIVTDARRFENPLDISEALKRVGFWSEAREVIVVSPDDMTNALWLEWLAEFQLGRKRLLDTLIAVTWHVAGVYEICTLNPRDFKVFEVFQIHCIGAENSGG